MAAIAGRVYSVRSEWQHGHAFNHAFEMDYTCAGHTNNFHVATKSQLALCYNDISVMENHHCAMAFSILDRNDCGLLQHLDKALQQVCFLLSWMPSRHIEACSMLRSRMS